ncbi:hypothetical protein [Blautia obeum]|nr:hypothetical protein [Blautia obeum]
MKKENIKTTENIKNQEEKVMKKDALTEKKRRASICDRGMVLQLR